MSRYRIESLNYMTSGRTEKMFNLDIVSYLKDKEKNSLLGSSERTFLIRTDDGLRLIKLQLPPNGNDEFNKKSKLKNRIYVACIDSNDAFGGGSGNKFSLQSTIDSSIIIHPIFQIEDVCIKSSIKKVKNSASEYKNKSSDYIDIYTPSIDGNIKDVCQLDNYAYFLTERTNEGPKTLVTNLKTQRQETQARDIVDSFYSYQIQSYNLPTYIYNISSDMTEKDREVLSNYYKPSLNVSNIKYNYMVEIPQNLPEGVYNDYESGDIQGDIFQSKNVYDAMYDMNMPNISTLQNTRDYIGVAVCGGVSFLKFYDNITYTFPNDRAKENCNVINNVAATEHTVTSYPFQKIETLDSINRFKSNVKHKSGLFSITLKNTALGTIDESKPGGTDLKNKIKNDIKNNIRDITKKLCPVTTQLFDVYFDD